MRWFVIVCSSLGFASVAIADPTDARAKYREAIRLASDGDNEKALTLVDDGLALAPRDLPLLEVRGSLLLKTRDYEAALSAYQTYIDAGPTGANRRAALKIVASLAAVKTSFLDLGVSNGPATVYLDARSQGVFCTAAPGCRKGLLPGDYKVIVERTGFERFTARVTVELAHTATLAVTLIEKPSQLTIATTPAGAELALDGKLITSPATITGGDHQLVITADHFATIHRALPAHEGQPVALDVALVPLVPITVPADAALTLDGAQVVVEQGGLAVPPGPHILVAHASGFHDAQIGIPAERPADLELAIVLQPIGALVDVAGAPAGSKLVVDGHTIGTTPLATPIEVAPGPHRIELRADGYLPYRDHSAFAGNQAVHLRLSRLRPDSRRWTRWSALGTGVGLAVGGVTSWLALKRHSDYDARARLPGVTQDDPALQSLKSDGGHFALAADLGFGIALIGAVATTYFFLHEGRGESEGSLQLGVGPGAATLTGRF